MNKNHPSLIVTGEEKNIETELVKSIKSSVQDGSILFYVGVSPVVLIFIDKLVGGALRKNVAVQAIIMILVDIFFLLALMYVIDYFYTSKNRDEYKEKRAEHRKKQGKFKIFLASVILCPLFIILFSLCSWRLLTDMPFLQVEANFLSISVYIWLLTIWAILTLILLAVIRNTLFTHSDN